jgi:serine/threonine-protein kinase
MATVLLCHDERLDRRVAVKRLHADSPGEMEQRFLREAKLGASLNHPNLVSVFDTETDAEGVLIVMEYVEGESLARALLRGPLDPEHVAGIARDLGDALDHAHAQGVVHRDVKPANVLLRDDGVTKLADLGIATAADQTRITRSGTVLGSAAYMAPEQLEGRPVGPEGDVYALATVCFEALSGRRARSGRTPVEIAHRIATADPPDLREHAPGLPAAAAAALARGMGREPGDRQRSAGELAAELAGALERGLERRPERRPDPVATTAPLAAPVRSHAARSARRPFESALALGLLALAVAAVVAAVLLSGGGDGDGGQRAQEPQSEAQAGQRDGREQAEAPGAEAPADEAPAGEAPVQETPAEDAPAEEAPAEETPAAPDPERGAALNAQGFELMGSGDYAAAVPVLQEAVASWPEDSRDLEYAYALYNLGKSLNQAGRAAEAIPYLEKRLTWANQRGVVKQELRLARRNAGQ